MSTVTLINISIEIFCSILTFIILICVLVGDNLQLCVNRAFIWVLLSNIAVMLSDALAFYSIGKARAPFFVLNFMGNFLCFLFSYIVIMCFSNYLNTYLLEKFKISRASVYIVYGICGFAIALTFLSPVNDMYFIIDDQNIYHRQGGYWISQVLGMLGMLVNAAVIFKHRKYMNRMERFALFAYIILPIMAITIQMLVYGYVAVYIASTTTILIIYIGMQAQYSKMLKEKEMQLTESRTAIMLSQIQPHFLYNTLNTIENFCYKDAETAARLVRDFSGYLRDNMDSLTQRELVSFERELEHVRVYLEIEKLRFEERLNIVYDLEVIDFELPILTVQPIVENAVRHGVTKRVGGGTVVIATRKVPEGISVIITDDGVGFNPEQAKLLDGLSHIGIENVRRRLNAQCGGMLSVESVTGIGTVCTITILSERID